MYPYSEVSAEAVTWCEYVVSGHKCGSAYIEKMGSKQGKKPKGAEKFNMCGKVSPGEAKQALLPKYAEEGPPNIGFAVRVTD